MADPTALFYSEPSYVGAGFPVFSGGRRQRGGNILGSSAKMVLPTLKSAGNAFLNRAEREAFGLAGDLGMAALSGRGLKGVRQTLQQQGLKRLTNAGKVALGTALNTLQGTQFKLNRQRRPPSPPPPTPILGKRKTSAPTRATSYVKHRRRGGGSDGAIANF